MPMRCPFVLMTTVWLALAASAAVTAEPPSRSTATGVVTAQRTVDIAAKRQERITAIHVDRGDRVAAGALLVETDADELLADKAAAEAELGAARVERDYRTRSAGRLERLARSESLAEDRLDEARYSLAAAEQRLRLAEARLRKIDALLKDTRIAAPFAGVITARAAELGQLTRPGEPLLRLEDHSTLELHTRVKLKPKTHARPDPFLRGPPYGGQRVHRVDDPPRPVSESEGVKTRLSDLALVCANCHRMIHARRPWLSIEGLRDLRKG